MLLKLAGDAVTAADFTASTYRTKFYWRCTTANAVAAGSNDLVSTDRVVVAHANGVCDEVVFGGSFLKHTDWPQ